MARLKVSLALCLLTALVAMVSVTAVVAQYGTTSTGSAGSAGTCNVVLDDVIENELDEAVTTNISLTVNNILINILNIGNSPSRRYDRRGYPIIEIGSDQGWLPIVGGTRGYLQTRAILALEDTDFEWGVKVERSGLFLTEFPMHMFPPGSYYMTLCETRAFRVEIPEDYAPSAADIGKFSVDLGS